MSKNSNDEAMLHFQLPCGCFVSDLEESFNCNEDIEKVMKSAEGFVLGTDVNVYYNEDNPAVSFISFEWLSLIPVVIVLIVGIFPIVMYFYVVFNEEIDIQSV